MRTHIIEATNGPNNWGKFLIGVWDEEWKRRPAGPGCDAFGAPLLRAIGWGPDAIMVFDLQTGEGAMFHPRPTAHVKPELDKHKIWVCPLFEPFLTWLYKQPLDAIKRLELPPHVDLPDAAFELRGYRRPGEGKK